MCTADSGKVSHTGLGGSVVGSTRALDEPSVKTASAHFLARPSGEGSNLPICSVPPLPAPGHYIYFFVCV